MNYRSLTLLFPSFGPVRKAGGPYPQQPRILTRSRNPLLATLSLNSTFAITRVHFKVSGSLHNNCVAIEISVFRQGDQSIQLEGPLCSRVEYHSGSNYHLQSVSRLCLRRGMKGKGPTQILPLRHQQPRSSTSFNNALGKRIGNSNTDICLSVRYSAIVEDVTDGT